MTGSKIKALQKLALKVDEDDLKRIKLEFDGRKVYKVSCL